MRSVLLASVLLWNAGPAVAGKLFVVTTTQDLASLTREVAGDRVEIVPIAKGYQDPHFVDAKPSYVLLLSRADLLIAVGLELEVGWLPALVQQARNPKLLTSTNYLDPSTAVEILERPKQQVTRALGDVHPFGNPHYWLDPENGRATARAIAEKLAALDPAGAEVYRKNLAAFEQRLDQKEKEWEAEMAPYAGTEIVTYHNSWPNFAKRFQLRVVGYIEPKPGIPPGPAHVAGLIDMMKSRRVPLILMEPYFDSKLPKSIADKTGATLLIFIPSVGGVPEAKDYFSLFDYDVKLLADALAAKKGAGR
jgi:zinc/manganese transport system substrate-binding protein